MEELSSEICLHVVQIKGIQSGGSLVVIECQCNKCVTRQSNASSHTKIPMVMTLLRFILGTMTILVYKL